MNILKILIIAFLVSCTVQSKDITEISPIDSTESNTSMLKDEMNAAIIDGFFDNDTTGLSNTIYLLK